MCTAGFLARWSPTSHSEGHDVHQDAVRVLAEGRLRLADGCRDILGGLAHQTEADQ